MRSCARHLKVWNQLVCIQSVDFVHGNMPLKLEAKLAVEREHRGENGILYKNQEDDERN